jgi:protein phosphatase
VDSVGLSHPGLVRPTNEDAYAVLRNLGLFIVADGMGGAAAGEVASYLAVDTVREMFEDPEAVSGMPLLIAAVQSANACIRAVARADRTKRGMGTTLTALLVLQDRIAIAHVGDSRAYHLRGRRLDQITEDHTLVGALRGAGLMTAEDAAASEYQHMLLRAVGVDEEVTVDARLLAVETGDTLLLTSDGVHGVVGDEDIAVILADKCDLKCAATRLIERANDAGGRDNATVVVLRIG